MKNKIEQSYELVKVSRTVKLSILLTFGCIRVLGFIVPTFRHRRMCHFQGLRFVNKLPYLYESKTVVNITSENDTFDSVETSGQQRRVHHECIRKSTRQWKKVFAFEHTQIDFTLFSLSLSAGIQCFGCSKLSEHHTGKRRRRKRM